VTQTAGSRPISLPESVMPAGQASSTARPALRSTANCANTPGVNRTPNGVNDSRNAAVAVVVGACGMRACSRVGAVSARH